MGRYFGSQFGTVWKYVFAEQENALYRLPTEFDIGNEMEMEAEEDEDAYGVSIAKEELEELRELTLKLANGMNLKQIHPLGKDALLKYIDAQTEEWKIAAENVITGIRNSNTFDDLGWLSIGITSGGKNVTFPISQIYKSAIAPYIKDDFYFIDMLWAIINHMEENIQHLAKGEVFFFEEW